MPRFNLPVFFRGKRTYIQGSLILSLAAERLRSEGLIKSLPTAQLLKSKFNQISNKGVIFLPSGECPLDNDVVLGEAIFKEDGQIHSVSFVEDNKISPPHEVDRHSLIQRLEVGKPLNGSCDYAIEASLDALIASVIEAVKALHTKLSEDVYDIWFTGFSGAEFPMDTKKIVTQGNIIIKNLMVKRVGKQFQTLFRVTINDSIPAQTSTFMLTFAYKDCKNET